MTIAWTKTPPTVTGWYWRRIIGAEHLDTPHVERVGLSDLESYDACAPHELRNYRWAGPIPEPLSEEGRKA